MRLLLSLVASVVAAAVFSGCGTFISTPIQKIKTTSSPAGAEIYVDGMSQGRTPNVIEVSRWDDHEVTIQLRGYQPYHVELKRGANPWHALNITNGYILGLVVDASSGAIYRLNPREIHVDLFPRGVRRSSPPVEHAHSHAGAGTRSDGRTLRIATTTGAKAEWVKVGQMEKL